MLLVGLFFRNRLAALWSSLGYVVGGVSVLIGLVGVIFHLESRFFYERTILSLTYSAPFAAPLAYTGLGFLLIMNRMVESKNASSGLSGSSFLPLADLSAILYSL